MSKSFTIIVSVVHSNAIDAIGFTGELRTSLEAAAVSAEEVRQRILAKVPYGRVCSLVIGEKDGEP